MIARLRKLGAELIWVNHDATRDLDVAVAEDLSAARHAVFSELREKFANMGARTLSMGHLSQFKPAVTELVFALTSSSKFAHLTDRMYDKKGGLFSHCTNVAYLSLLVGLEMEAYIIKERSRLNAEAARDLVSLGLGAALHDIGKTAMDPGVRKMHEIHRIYADGTASDELDYDQHPLIGYRMLADTRMPASAKQVVLNHHQRFDGSGFPAMDQISRGRHEGPQAGHDIHIFSRIVAAANVLENLITDAEGCHRPVVAALNDFVQPCYRDWFDPVVRALMARRVPPFPVGSLVRLSDNRRAVVVAPNFVQPCQPTVRVLPGSDRDITGSEDLVDTGPRGELHIAECAGQRVEPYLFVLPYQNIDKHLLIGDRMSA